MPKAPPDSESPSAGFGSRGALVAVGAAEGIVAVLAYAGASWPLVLYQLVTDGAILSVWLAAATGAGALVLRAVWRFDLDTPRLLRLVTDAALGLGLISLVTLLFGLGGIISGAGVIAGGILCGALALWPHRRRFGDGDIGAPVRAWLTQPAGWNWLWLLVLPLLAIALVGATVPPGFLWTPDEPHGYDVVEYHLQIPREWYEAGKILPLGHNVFSYFPFGVEMHYLLAMDLRGGPWKGMYLAQLMHVAHVVLAVFAIHGVAMSLAPRKLTAVSGGVIGAAVPWLTLLAPVAYNEGGLLLYGTLAIGWALRAIDAAPRIPIIRFTLAGVMAGFACGVKLTAVPMLLAAVPVAVVVAWPRGVRYAWVMLVVGAVLYSPWALRNLAWAGNPVFPEGMRLLGKAHFSDVQVERWERAHSPRPDQKTVAARLSAGGREILADWRFGYVPIALGLVAIVCGYRDRRARALSVLFVLFLLFWLFLTHLQGRFFVIAVPVVALMIALADWGRAAPAVAVLAAASSILSWGMVHARFTDKLYGPNPLVGVLGADDLSGVNPLASSVPADAPLVLVGEARAFYFPRPMTTLHYCTVFDVDTSAQPDIVQAWRGPPADNEWLLVNPSELQRFADTYWGIPQPPPEWKGKVEPAVIPPGPRR